MKKNITILISSAGRRCHLINCFRRDAEELGISLKVVAIDTNPLMSSACQIADKALKVCKCTDSQFITEVLGICQSEKVDLVIPTIDTELQIYADTYQDFLKIGTRVVISDKNAISICNDKYLTTKFLEKNGICVPQTALANNLSIDELRNWNYPLIFKPKGGSSSIGIFYCKSFEELKKEFLEKKDYIVQECLSGEEYTVNLFFDQSGALKMSIPHLRYETRGGEVSKGITKKIDCFNVVAKKLAQSSEKFIGAICFQGIFNKKTDKYIVFEINARFGGGYPLAHKAGGFFSKWLLEEKIGKPLEIDENSWAEEITMLRYDDAIFLKNGVSFPG